MLLEMNHKDTTFFALPLHLLRTENVLKAYQKSSISFSEFKALEIILRCKLYIILLLSSFFFIVIFHFSYAGLRNVLFSKIKSFSEKEDKKSLFLHLETFLRQAIV